MFETAVLLAGVFLVAGDGATEMNETHEQATATEPLALCLDLNPFPTAMVAARFNSLPSSIAFLDKLELDVTRFLVTGGLLSRVA